MDLSPESDGGTESKVVAERGELNDDLAASLPYYLESFRFIIASTRHDDNLNTLLSEDSVDLAVLKKFDEFEPFLQRLYVRLFLRKYVWLKRERIKYDDEFGGTALVDQLLDDLCTAGFLENQISNMELGETLKMLSMSQLKDLTKQFRVGVANSTKKDLVRLTVQKVREQRTPFGAPLVDIVRKAALKLLGKVYRLEDSVREVFLRILSMFQLTAGFSTATGQNPIFSLMQVNLGLVKFPNYPVLSSHRFFSSMEEFKTFERARRWLDSAFLDFEDRKYEEVKSAYLKALPFWERIIEDEPLTSRILALPPYLRRFTVGYQYTKLMEKGLEALERLDEKSDAINGYMQLLDQATYVTHHRGDWYNRLTILLIRIDKRPDAAARLLLRGIKDELVRPQHRLELCDRLRRILKQLQDSTRKEVVCMEMGWTVRPPVSVEIKGRLCPTEKMGKGKSVFIHEKGDVSSVEELALSHYLENGYTEGIHDEGALFMSLYGLLCWDIIYQEPVLNVFRSKFQTVPLDLTCSTFVSSRKTATEAKISSISNQTISDIIDFCIATWTSQLNVHTPLVSWDRLQSVEYLTGLLGCFIPVQLSRLIDRYTADFGAVRSGFPDLTVWNPVTRRVKVVEVKGPNDRLSHKQSIWIDFLMDIGVDVEVCHVVASGAKRKSSVLNDE